MITLVMSAIALLISYLAVAIINFGIPPSISDTFYLYNSKKKGLGYIFTLFMFAEAFLMISPMLTLTEGQWFMCFAFFCPCGIALCGSAPLFKEKDVKIVHFIGAFSGAIFGLLWAFLIDTPVALFTCLGMVGIAITLGVVTKTEEECRTFWLEIAGFGSIAIVLAVEAVRLG